MPQNFFLFLRRWSGVFACQGNESTKRTTLPFKTPTTFLFFLPLQMLPGRSRSSSYSVVSMGDSLSLSQTIKKDFGCVMNPPMTTHSQSSVSVPL